MTEFHLVDLVSQRHAVAQHLHGKSDAEIVEWLAARGHLVRQVIGGRETYHFESLEGLRATFFLDAGELVFFSDHSTFT